MTDGLLILGASVRAAAQSALRAGFKVFAADLFADADLRQCGPTVAVADYPGGLVAAAASMPACPWMYTGGLENHPDLVAEISRTRILYGNPPEVLRGVRDPARLHAELTRAGLAVPPFSLSSPRLPDDGTWLRKAYRGSGGAEVGFWLGGLHSDRYFYQQYVAGESVAAVYVAGGGDAVLLGVTRQLVGSQWAGAHGFLYVGSVGPLPLPASTTEEFQEIGRVLTRQFGLAGLFGVDAVLANNAAWTIEVNPRYTASVEILERAIGIPAIALHVQACRGQRLPRGGKTPDCRFGKAIVYARRDVVIPADFGRRAAAAGPDMADISDAGTEIRHGHPVTTVFAEATDEASVIETLKARVAEVESFVDRPDTAPG